MKNEKVSEEIQYITQILDIMENNFAQKKKKRVIPMEEIHEMMVDLYKLFNECYANEQIRCSIISIKRYIPLLNMLMRIDRENANEYQLHIKNAFKMAARTSLTHYMVYREWDDKDKFFSPRFEIMEGYIHYLEEIAKNPKFTLLIANMPSGYGKTYPEKISEAWNFGVDNTGTVLSLCSNDDVVKGGSRTVIDEMKSEHFGEVFPDMKWDKEDKQYFLKETDSNWKLKKCKLSSSYYARTTQSNVVGCRASQRIHIDDLYADYKEAMNQNLNEYYYNKFLTVWRKRFVQNKDAKVVVTGTLWASGDFIALLIEMVKKQHKFHPSEKYKYTQVSEDGSVAVVQVPALDYETGYSTCPELKTTAEILEEKRNMDEYLFETNFQQRPTDPEALAFSYNKLRTYETIPPSDFQSGYAVIDATRKTGRDFFAMPIFVKVPNGDTFDYYLKDCLFTQTATKDMYEAICEKIMEHHIIKLVIESNVTSELKKNIDDILSANGVAFCEIGEKYNYENKEARITDQKGNISRKLIFPAKELFGRNTDMGAFMNSLTMYNTRGGNEHDDAADACGMFCHEIIEEGGFSPKIQVLKRPF